MVSPTMLCLCVPSQLSPASQARKPLASPFTTPPLLSPTSSNPICILPHFSETSIHSCFWGASHMLFVLCLQSGFSPHLTTSLLCCPSHVTNPVSFLVALSLKLDHGIHLTMVLSRHPWCLKWWAGLNLNQEHGNQPYGLVGLDLSCCHLGVICLSFVVS